MKKKAFQALLRVAACWLFCTTVSVAFGDALRHETGRRLRLFERDWRQTTDVEARRRALSPLKQCVNQFLGGKQLEAAQSLDRARFALRSSDELPANVRWAESIYVSPKWLLADAKAAELPLTVDRFYDTGLPIPQGARLVVAVVRDEGPTSERITAKQIDARLESLPAKIMLPLADLGEGDFVLRVAVLTENETLADGEYRFSLTYSLEARLLALHKEIAATEPGDRTVDRLSTVALANLLGNLATGTVAENDFPANRLLREAEEAIRAARRETSYYGGERAGQFWLRVPTARNEVPVRIFVPPRDAPQKPAPLVIALHGAGGSENLFFDGYGDGAIVEECAKRGWLLMSPRTSGFGLLPVAELTNALQKSFNVDPQRVFLVGHSMGAMQATAAALADSQLYAAVAALGGGGAAKAGAGLERLPYFVAAGSEDFALQPARRLIKALRDAGVEKLEAREYPDVEHLLVVQEALPDVFRFFDGVAQRAAE